MVNRWNASVTPLFRRCWVVWAEKSEISEGHCETGRQSHKSQSLVPILARTILRRVPHPQNRQTAEHGQTMDVQPVSRPSKPRQLRKCIENLWLDQFSKLDYCVRCPSGLCETLKKARKKIRDKHKQHKHAYKYLFRTCQLVGIRMRWITQVMGLVILFDAYCNCTDIDARAQGPGHRPAEFFQVWGRSCGKVSLTTFALTFCSF